MTGETGHHERHSGASRPRAQVSEWMRRCYGTRTTGDKPASLVPSINMTPKGIFISDLLLKKQTGGSLAAFQIVR